MEVAGGDPGGGSRGKWRSRGVDVRRARVEKAYCVMWNCRVISLAFWWMDRRRRSWGWLLFVHEFRRGV